MKAKTLTFSSLLLVVLLLQGCIIVDEDRYPGSRNNRDATIGEELEDLAEAYEDGLLSQQEYERLRRRILD